MININENKAISVANDTNFKQEVFDSSIPVMVDFFATWCGPCKYFSNVLSEVAPQYSDRVKFVKVNVDENPRVASEMGIYSVPTLMFVREGKIKKAFSGALPKDAFVSELNSFLLN